MIQVNWKITKPPQSNYNLFYLLLVSFLVFFSTPSSYANENIVDSLNTLLSNTVVDSERLQLMEELIDELINNDLDQAIIYTRKSLDLSRKMGDQTSEARALKNMGLTLYETSERVASLEYFEKSEFLAEKLGLRELQVRNLMHIAKYHRYTSRDSAKTVDNFLKSAEISKSIDFHWGSGRSYAKLASFYTKYNQIQLCEKYLELAAEYYIQHPDAEKTIAHYYTEVGDKIWSLNPNKSMELYFIGKEYKLIPNLMVSLAKAHSFIGENEIALNYLKEAIPYFQKTEKRKRMLGIAISQLAEVYILLDDYELADKACDQGMKLLKNLGRSDQKALPDFYRIKAKILEKQGNDDEALRYLTKSIEEAKRVKYAFARVNSTLSLGVFYSTRDGKEGKKFCRQSLKDARKKKLLHLEMESCDCLYKIYKSAENFKEALNFQEQKVLLSDSLNTMTISHALEINKKITEKDNLIAEQSYQEEIRKNELKNQYIIIASLLITMLLGVLFFGMMANSHRKISRKNSEINEKTNELLQANLNLERSNEELERFAHIASHDLKTPVRSIVSFTALLRRRLENEEKPNVNELLDFIEKGGKRMNQLIEDVLEYSRLSGETTAEKEIINLNQMVDEITQLIQNTSESNRLIFEVSELPPIKWIHSRIYLLLKNLIENGIKYNESQNPTIKVYHNINQGVHSIYIEDNGIGIDEIYFENVFRMFNRLHNNTKYEGTGLGLATCKKIVEEFEGEISITSEVNKGSIFKIDLPNNLIHQTKEIEVMEGEALQEI